MTTCRLSLDISIVLSLALGLSLPPPFPLHIYIHTHIQFITTHIPGTGAFILVPVDYQRYLQKKQQKRKLQQQQQQQDKEDDDDAAVKGKKVVEEEEGEEEEKWPILSVDSLPVERQMAISQEVSKVGIEKAISISSVKGGKTCVVSPHPSSSPLHRHTKLFVVFVMD